MRMRRIWMAVALLSACSRPREQSKQTEPPPKAPEVFRADPQTASTVSGKVTFTGLRPARTRIDISEDEECVRLNKSGLFDESIVVGAGGALASVFVYVKKGLEGKTFERPASPVVLDQKGCRFAPRVMGIRTGQTFRVTNSDPVTHNVHPVARNNREWNQSQAPGDPALERRFVRPEIMIRIKCNVHSWMRSWAAAIDHPYFAVTDATGSFEIANLPPGEYTIEAWHEKLGVIEKPMRVEPSSKTRADFTYNGGSLP